MAKTDSARLAVQVKVTLEDPSFVNLISADPEAFTANFSPLVNVKQAYYPAENDLPLIEPEPFSNVPQTLSAALSLTAHEAVTAKGRGLVKS